MKREYSIDCYKIFCMWGICFLHASGHVCHHPTQWLANLFYWCVPGFVFISGWFGVDFSLKKILKLYGIALYVVVVIQMLRMLQGHSLDFIYAVKMFRDFWFLNAYVALMMVSPALNRLTDPDKIDKNVIMPILLLSFGWAFCATIPGVRSFTPISQGVREGSVIMMSGVYIVGRMFRNCELEQWMSSKWRVVCLIISMMFAAFGLCSYTSPFSLVIAIAVFLMFKSNTTCYRIGRFCKWMIPSLFSIYLFHSKGEFGLQIMTNLEEALLIREVPSLAVYLIVAMGAFIAGILLDMPRRIGAYFVKMFSLAFKVQQ